MSLRDLSAAEAREQLAQLRWFLLERLVQHEEEEDRNPDRIRQALQHDRRNQRDDDVNDLDRIKDNGTARAMTWSGTQWRASSSLALPTTTTISKTMYLTFIFNSADTKWDLLGYLDNF